MKNLVIATVAPSEFSFYDKVDSFEEVTGCNLCLVSFDSSTSNKPDQCSHFFHKSGFKYRIIKEIIEENNFIDLYDYIWMPDYDNWIDVRSVRKLFEIAARFKFDLCQPSLSRNSYYSFDATLNQEGSIARLTNFAEVMCPLFSRRALKHLIGTFDLNYSSYGLDYLWANRLHYLNIGIIDAVQVHHVKPITSHDWKLPSNMTAHEEMIHLLREHDICPEKHKPRTIRAFIANQSRQSV